jgi:hypothetical protein
MMSYEARDLGREIAQLDPAKVRKRNFRAAIQRGSPPVDLSLDLSLQAMTRRLLLGLFAFGSRSAAFHPNERCAPSALRFVKTAEVCRPLRGG